MVLAVEDWVWGWRMGKKNGEDWREGWEDVEGV